MKLKELYNQLTTLMEFERFHDCEVEIKSNEKQWGSMPTIKVEAALMGSDWNAGKFILFPVSPMIVDEATPTREDWLKEHFDFLNIKYAVYEKSPAHGSGTNNVIMAPFNSKEEAEAAGSRYGYHGENYYVDILK